MACAPSSARQAVAALAEASVAQVFTPLLEQIIRNQHHRNLAKDLPPQRLSADAALQLRERQRRRPDPREQARRRCTVPSGRSAPLLPPRETGRSGAPRPGTRGRCALPGGGAARGSHPTSIRRASRPDRRARRAPLRAGRRGRTDTAGSRRRRGCRARSAARRTPGVGSHAPMSRCAIVPSSTPLTSASARTTSRADAPTRKLPVISLFQT